MIKIGPKFILVKKRDSYTMPCKAMAHKASFLKDSFQNRHMHCPEFWPKSVSARTPTDILADRNLPPRPFVDKLYSNFRQAILDGMQSVTDPAYAGSRLPLWIICFWVEMWKMHDIYECWRGGLQWLDQKVTSKSGKEAELYLEAYRLAQIIFQEQTSLLVVAPT